MPNVITTFFYSLRWYIYWNWNDTEKISMAPAQGWHAKSWSVPHFLLQTKNFLWTWGKEFFLFNGCLEIYLAVINLQVRLTQALDEEKTQKMWNFSKSNKFCPIMIKWHTCNFLSDITAVSLYLVRFFIRILYRRKISQKVNL